MLRQIDLRIIPDRLLTIVSWGTSSELAQQLLEGCHDDRCNCLHNVTAEVRIHPGFWGKNNIFDEIQAAATADTTQGCIEPVNNVYALCDADAKGLNVATTAVITTQTDRILQELRIFQAVLLL